MTTSSVLHHSRRPTKAFAQRFCWIRQGHPRGILWVTLLLVLVSGCGSSPGPESENHDNILASPAGLVLVEEEHPAGWGRPDCFGCHNANKMHQVNRPGLPDEQVGLPGIRAIIESGGEGSCTMCHGSNGVPQ